VDTSTKSVSILKTLRDIERVEAGDEKRQKLGNCGYKSNSIYIFCSHKEYLIGRRLHNEHSRLLSPCGTAESPLGSRKIDFC
jgi:hypothetical protein